MANNPITPTASSYVNGTIIDAQYMDDLASALNREVGFATQATAAGTKTLVLADLSKQEFTGTTAAQVVVMPVVTTLGIGMKWVISNKSTQTIAVNSSGGNLIFTVPAATDWLFTCALITGTTAASWSNSYAGASAAPTSASGLTLIKRASFSAVANTSTTFDGVFTSTYTDYLVVFENIRFSAAVACAWQFRYAGPTTATDANYMGAVFGYNSIAVLATTGSSFATSLTITTASSGDPTLGMSADILVTNVGNTSEDPKIVGKGINNITTQEFGGALLTPRNYTGFILTPASGTITGAINIYGLANA